MAGAVITALQPPTAAITLHMGSRIRSIPPKRAMRVLRTAAVSRSDDDARGSSLPDSLAFTAADAAFLRAMAMRPRLPEHNICWDDNVGDHNSIDGWHAQAWQMYAQGMTATTADASQDDDAE